MGGLLLLVLVASPLFSMAADETIQDPSISVGGIVAIVLLVAFSFVLLASCVYQSRKLNSARASATRVLRCGGCRRGFRVPASVADAEFMCSRCVTEGRRRMSQVLEEERVNRFARMKESANKTVKLQRVTSTFFKFARRSQSNLVASGSSSKVVTESTNESLVDARDYDCKICFDDQSCIVLLPCCHSGLCEGCAKDMVYMTKECYICRQEVELIAKVKPASLRQQATNEVLDEPPSLSACVVAPETLHHLASRCNTFDESSNNALNPHQVEATNESRRNTLHSLDEETAMSQPYSEAV